jgi:hypothetical protein
MYSEDSFDSSVFENNGLLKQYWDRVQTDRPTYYVPESSVVEPELPEDFEDLRAATLKAFEAPEAAPAITEAPEGPKASVVLARGARGPVAAGARGHIVEPKSISSTTSNVILIVALVLLAALVFMTMQQPAAGRRRS